MDAELRLVQQSDWITIVIFASLLLVVISKQLFQNRFLSFIILPFNNKYVTLYSKKDKMLHGFHILMTVFQFLNTSLYIYLSYQVLFKPKNSDGIVIYAIILSLIVLFFTVKMILQLTNGVVFGSLKMMTDFVYNKLTYLNYSGLIMLVANVVLTYIFKDSTAVVFASLFLILTINCIGIINILKNHQKLISGYFFYFILYLCALEIAPLIFIANYLKY